MKLSGATGEYVEFGREWNSDADYVVAHTSGSTGTPKEIRLLKSDMRVSARATNRFFHFGSDAVMYTPLSAHYIAGKMMLVRAYEADCRLIVETPSNRLLADVRIIDSDSIDLMCVVPSQAPSLLDNMNAHALLRNLIVGGAPLPADIEERLTGMPWKTYVTYGMTETCSHVALREVGFADYQALPGIRFSVDERGCLVINSDAYSFRSLTTNDVVELKSEIEFRWLGRADNVINSGGVKFHPEELERLLSGYLPCPFYIHRVSHPIWGETVGLTLERTEQTPDRESVIDICRRVLPHYAIPRDVRVLDEFPRTSSGKIRRQ